jgi:hypothetical protein
MADTKLADLTALTAPSGDDLLYVVDDPAGTPSDKKLALDNLFTRGTVTVSSPVIDAAQTWNDGAVTFTGLKFNVVSDTSASGSLLMDLQVGGVSQFSIRKDGKVGIGKPTSASFSIDAFGAIQASQFAVSQNTGAFYFSDTFLTRRAAANFRFGLADAAAPVAQTLSVQSVVAGTTNIAGANLTITGSQGTGTGAGGSIIFQVAPAGSSGTAQNALATALTIASTTDATFANAVNAGATSHIGFSSRSRLSSPADGVIRFSNNAVADFDRLQFGGTTSSFPALKRSSASLIVRLADDTANAALESASLKTDAPTGGTAATWKLGTVASVTPTLQNRTIEVDIGGTIYYISAKTTND